MDTQTRIVPGGLVAGIDSAGYSHAGGTPSWRSGPSPSPTPKPGNTNPSTPLPPPNNVVPRSLTERESQLVKHLSRLQFFLATAPTRWTGSDDVTTAGLGTVQHSVATRHPNLNRFPLPNGEYVSCVFWNGLYHITGTDIVRALVFRFEAFSRPVQNIKKFEEGVFSDLRNLKPGTDACLEEPKSPFLDLLFRNGCIRTQKKQKVFYWFSVPHDRLFLDALERDLKREKADSEPTTAVLGEPARSFRYDPKRGLYEQFAGKQPGLNDSNGSVDPDTRPEGSETGTGLPLDMLASNDEVKIERGAPHVMQSPSPDIGDLPILDTEDSAQPETATSVLFSRSLLKGSPAYKQRRKKASREKRQRSRTGTAGSIYDSGNDESGSDGEAPLAVGFAPSSMMGNALLSSFGGTLNSSFPNVPHHMPGININSLSTGSGVAVEQSLEWAQPLSYRSPALHNITTADTTTVQLNAETKPESNPSPAPSLSLNNTPSKGFSCPLLSCGRLFKRLEHLKRHVRTHTQERPYECTRCAKRFSRSDNLTQHVKTHEKADRGERLKTEASESTEDDVVRYLEAEVDAMTARETRNYIYRAETVGYHTGQGNSSFPRVFPQLLGATGANQATGSNEHFGNPAPSAWQQIPNPSWASLREGSQPLSVEQSESSILKRHRSMTPNLLLGRNDTSSTRYHPYMLPPIAGAQHLASHRSSSVDSFQIGNRITAAPTNQLLPNASNAHKNQNSHQHIARPSYHYQSQDVSGAVTLYSTPGAELSVETSVLDGIASTDTIAESSGFAEWANGSV